MSGNIQLFVNLAAPDITHSLVRAVNNMQPVGLPQLTMGDNRTFELYLCDGLGAFSSISGSGAYIPYIALGSCAFPAGGTFTLTFGGQTTANIAYNATTIAVQATLQALSSIGTNNCTVVGVPGEYYVVQFVGALGGVTQAAITANPASLIPTSTIDVNTLVAGGSGINNQQLVQLEVNPVSFSDTWTPISNGWVGQLSAATLELLEAFAAAGTKTLALALTLQISIQDPSGNYTTYAQIAVVVNCTIINPSAFSPADKPSLVTQSQLAAAVLGVGNFTYQALAPGGPGNYNISPTTTSRNHSADITLPGSTGGQVYNFALQTNNAPNAGDTVIMLILPGTALTRTINIYNSTVAGTLLDTIQVNETSDTAIYVKATYNGAAWEITFDSSKLAGLAQNLTGIASPLISKRNLRTMFSTTSAQTASFTITATQDGTFFPCSANAGAVVVTLPSAVTAGANAILAISKTDTSVNSVTTSPGTASLVSQNALLILISDGTNWDVLLNTQSIQPSPTGSLTDLAYPAITALTGNTSTTLDGIAVAAGATKTGQIVTLVYANQLVLRYQLFSGSPSAALPFKVLPADASPYYWQLLSVTYQGVPCSWNSTQTKYQPIILIGAVGAETTQIGPAITIS